MATTASTKPDLARTTDESTAAARMPRAAVFYLWSVIAAGALVCALSIYRLTAAGLPTTANFPLLLLASITVFIGNRFIIRIPGGNGEITIVGVFYFIIMLLFGGEAAIITATVDGLISGTRYNRRKVTILFAGASVGLATALTAFALNVIFGKIEDLPGRETGEVFVVALGVMGLVQFAGNTGLVALGVGLKKGLPFWATWQRYYLWSSIVFFAAAGAAGVTARLVVLFGWWAAFATAPVVVIVFLTYKTYLQNIEIATAHAEAMERHALELQRYIDEQERIRQQFLGIEKLSSLGELASGVAHNFNNNLAVILGRAELLLRRAEDPQTQRGLTAIIKSATDGAKTVRRIQDFARQRQDHNFVLVSVAALLREAREITKPRWKNQAELENREIHCEVRNETQAAVLGDAAELRDVLVNLIFNAVDAMPGGGTITLAARDFDETATVEMTIADTGGGMPEEVRTRIFDPFFTTKGVFGMGMGLAVSSAVIARHNGTIECESELGRGTTMRIRLPVAEFSPPELDSLEQHE